MSKRRRLTPNQRQMIYDKMNGHCAYCECKISKQEMQVDHVFPLRKGGEDILENMFPPCRSCNHYKSTLTVEQFKQMLEKIPHTLTRDSASYRNAVRFGLIKPKAKKITFYFETIKSSNDMSSNMKKVQKRAGGTSYEQNED